MTMNPETIKFLGNLVGKEIGTKQLSIQVQKEKDRKATVAETMAIVAPMLEEVKRNSKLNESDLKGFAKGIVAEVLNQIVIPTPQANVKVDAPVMPEIKVPESKITVKQEPIKIPTIKVPTPKVTVNVPQAKAPIVNMPKETKVHGQVSIEGVDDKHGMPVKLVDKMGNPIDLSVIGGSGSSGSGKSDYFTIKGIEALKEVRNGVATTTAGTAVQLSSTSIEIKKVTVVARTTNNNTVVVGGKGVVAGIDGEQIGTELYPGSSHIFDIDNLNKVWIDVLNSNDGVNYAYLY